MAEIWAVSLYVQPTVLLYYVEYRRGYSRICIVYAVVGTDWRLVTLAGLPAAHRQMQMQVGDDLPGGNCTSTPSSTDIPPGVVISTSAELTLRSKWPDALHNGLAVFTTVQVYECTSCSTLVYSFYGRQNLVFINTVLCTLDRVNEP